ncbi:MAG: TIGR01620 family protein [Geminicoccaceae bacterium]|nr:TIGR01620 family protein [Geminicoccaceae bacterium]MCS7266530.1 TIGR01620 family protein [Geminicoccaceae bacterium]MCX7628957.1 TIGR01620 family protein [Geminicoccaceae bacterium]MDW8123874.1 TIGR01620 family protein [Geminicoccaceae bacterium]MDW8340063.1 TIGR01620 family protein [Geminicoccaceae bacterium]
MTAERSPPRPFELDAASAPLVAEPEPDLSPAEAPPRAGPPAPARSPSPPVGRIFVIGLFALFFLGALRALRELVNADPWLGWPIAVLFVLVTAAAGILLGRELAALRRLARRARLRAEALRLARSALHGSARELLDAIASELARDPETARALARFRASASDALADGERLVLFERLVLAPLDRRAYRIVYENARDIGLLTALSPVGVLDALFVAWRTVHLLGAVARLYGMAPRPTATLALLRRCARNAALAGLAEIASDGALEGVGASLLAGLSVRAGQGAGNALLLARFGLEAIREIRPLPFLVERPPSLAQLRKAAGAAFEDAPRAS